MRKYKKTALFNRLKIVENANQLLIKLIDKDNIEGIQILLPDIQTEIISIGEEIEGCLGEGCAEVKPLEEICEVIWQINELCSSDNKSERNKEQRKKSKVIYTLINKFRTALNEVQEERVVIFFPYKAAMWDSLNGAYEMAIADVTCSVMVVPIPFYEKNADGSLGSSYYEKELFDPKLNLYDYDKLDYEQIHPEEVYIHNPYDKYNHVTTIHPFFYCENIKKFTDKLIYIPYFIHQNDVVQDHYCVLPGTIYADEVWLQSESVRRQYIKYYKAEIPSAKDIDKFIVHKSSKLDKYEFSESMVPDEWKEFLYANGKKRKIIFFNTHLSCLMQDTSEDFFLKIEEIFDIFRDNSKVLLLWRPHPLTISTIKSMNPEAEGRYFELVKRYQDEKIGIFDDTPDVHRALNMSDAYYGSRSSVVEMFKEQNKPIMLMNLEIHN